MQVVSLSILSTELSKSWRCVRQIATQHEANQTRDDLAVTTSDNHINQPGSNYRNYETCLAVLILSEADQEGR